MARLQQSLRQRSSASDSNLRCHEGEWPACSSRRGCDLPRPILFFVAAKENSPPATAVAATRSASDSILRCREGEWFRLQNATTPPMHRFLISSSDLGIDAATLTLQLRIARLQRSRGVQAGAGCHEGGIILSKKPPVGACPCRNNAPWPILSFVAAKEVSQQRRPLRSMQWPSFSLRDPLRLPLGTIPQNRTQN